LKLVVPLIFNSSPRRSGPRGIHPPESQECDPHKENNHGENNCEAGKPRIPRSVQQARDGEKETKRAEQQVEHDNLEPTVIRNEERRLQGAIVFQPQEQVGRDGYHSPTGRCNRPE
jgi:hypothetical protein